MNNEVANNNWDEPWSLFGAFMESNMRCFCLDELIAGYTATHKGKENFHVI
jgi:hypothetical protein